MQCPLKSHKKHLLRYTALDFDLDMKNMCWTFVYNFFLVLLLVFIHF